MTHYKRLKNKRLGDILVEEGLASKEAVITALQAQQTSGRLMSDSLLEARELSDYDLARAIVEQYQAPFVDLSAYTLHKDLIEEFPTELLHRGRVLPMDRFGSVASSGTVTEPYAIQDKFPTSLMYVYYAAGATMAESFYMSVKGPYQLLIVGDPLCRPFSIAPKQNVDASLRMLKKDEATTLDLDLSGPNYLDWADDPRKATEKTEALAPATIEVIQNGVKRFAVSAKKRIKIEAKIFEPAYSEFTLKFVADDPLAQSSQFMMPFWIGNPKLIEMQLPKDLPQPIDEFGKQVVPIPPALEKIKIAVKAPGAQRISIWNNWEQIAMSRGEQGDLSIDLTALGTGPVRLQAKAETAEGKMISSLPVWISIGRESDE